MAHVHTIAPEDADGPLAEIYAAAVQRAGRVFNILRVQSLNPAALDASMRLYLALMRGPSPLSRLEREAIAVVVSRSNDCFYWISAHRDDLRDEVAQELARGTQPLGANGPTGAAAFAADVAAQGSEAAPTPKLRALLQYAERVAVQPASVTAAHVQALRDAGYDDRAIHDAAQVAAYFSYINRVADGLGVDPEPEMEGG